VDLDGVVDEGSKKTKKEVFGNARLATKANYPSGSTYGKYKVFNPDVIVGATPLGKEQGKIADEDHASLIQ